MNVLKTNFGVSMVDIFHDDGYSRKLYKKVILILFFNFSVCDHNYDCVASNSLDEAAHCGK